MGDGGVEGGVGEEGEVRIGGLRRGAEKWEEDGGEGAVVGSGLRMAAVLALPPKHLHIHIENQQLITSLSRIRHQHLVLTYQSRCHFHGAVKVDYFCEKELGSGTGIWELHLENCLLIFIVLGDAEVALDPLLPPLVAPRPSTSNVNNFMNNHVFKSIKNIALDFQHFILVELAIEEEE